MLPLPYVSFTSYQYFALLAFAFLFYWVIPSQLLRRRFLVLMSFIFYALWNYRFFGLLVISASADYFAARLIHGNPSPKARKLILVSTMIINFGILGFFKYFNFFVESLNFASRSAGLQEFNFFVDVALPLGISFYTFHTVSYTIDVYRGKVAPITDFWDYFLFVGYFPQLVAGPIARVDALFPQFFVKKTPELNRVAQGVLMICFGLLMKVLVADTLGMVVEFVFAKTEVDATLGWLGVFSFGYQIYVDFWAYTIIARGSSRLFGIELNLNFMQPYLSASPTEFWRRWHMSLSSWFRDYVYIPLGGNREHATRNIILTMTIAGLWHGSSVLFILWGLYHGLLLVIFKSLRLPKLVSWAATFLLVNLGWILFRSQSIEQAVKMFKSLVNFTPFDQKWSAALYMATACILFTMLVDLCFQLKDKFQVRVPVFAPYLKLSLAGTLLMLVIYLGESSATPFIYFNF